MKEQPHHQAIVAVPDAASTAHRRWRLDGAFQQLLFASALVLVSVSLRVAVDPWLGNHQPFTPSFAAIALTAWFGGWRSGVITAVGCYLLSNYLLIPPRHELSFGHEDIAGTGTYFLTTGVILYLAHRARQANRALTRITQQLRQAQAHKTGFLALLGHELRDPLASVRAGMELLHGGALAPHERAAAQAMVQRQLGHVMLLLDDLLDIARIDEGRIALCLRDVSLVAAVADATSAAREFTEPLEQGIGIDIPPQVDTIRADPARLAQVLVNLLHNASKFSPRGSRITIVAEPLDGRVAITVRDSGIGIAPDQLRDIFDTFVQLTQADRRRPGLGLGLALVSRLMAMHGGSVTAHSEGPGTGSSFTVTFPRGESASAAPGAKGPAHERRVDPVAMRAHDGDRAAALRGTAAAAAADDTESR